MGTFDVYISFLNEQHKTTSFNITLKSVLSSANALVDIAKSANAKLEKFPNFDEKIAADINLTCQNKEEVETMISGANDVISAIDMHVNTIEPKFQELYKIIKERSFSQIQVQQMHLEMAEKLSNRRGNTFSSSKSKRLGIEIDDLLKTIQSDLKERDRLKELGDSRKLQIVIGSGLIIIVLLFLIFFNSSKTNSVPNLNTFGPGQDNIPTQKKNVIKTIPTNKSPSPSTYDNSSNPKNSNQSPKEQTQQFKWTTCSDCNGQGQIQSNMPCQNCSGDGLATCSKCNGLAKYVCSTCNGDKQLVCSRCEGKKQFECSRCNGAKSFECRRCLGKGILSCGKCFGDGISYSRSCDACNGKGNKPCSSCNQSGRLACPTCSQTGYQPCPSCSQTGYKPCSSCSQTGYKPCLYCNQIGNIKCNICNGLGQISKNVSCPKCESRGQIQVKI